MLGAPGPRFWETLGQHSSPIQVVGASPSAVPLRRHQAPEAHPTYVGWTVWTLPWLQDIEPLRAIHSPALIS